MFAGVTLKKVGLSRLFDGSRLRRCDGHMIVMELVEGKVVRIRANRTHLSSGEEHRVRRKDVGVSVHH
jgi:hypothetical protein